MNQVECQKAIKKLIADNEDALVLGFYHQGTYRSISDIGITPLIPPRDYYYFLVLVQSASERDGSVRTTRSVSEKTYECSIGIVDIALTQRDDTVPYEIMSNDFRTLCDRVVNLLRSTGSFVSDNGDKFRLQRPDRSVQIRNSDRTWTADFAVFFATVSFTVEEC